MNYKNEQAEHKYCLECGDEIVFGRSDKKFCSQKCKNDHNNRIGYGDRRFKERTVKALEKNYSILSTLLGSGVTSISLLEIAQLGFNREYITGYHRNGCHDEFCCFNIKYFQSGNKLFHIGKMHNFAE